MFADVPDITIINPVSCFHHIQGVGICENALVETVTHSNGIGCIEVSVVLLVVLLVGDDIYDRPMGKNHIFRRSYGIILYFFDVLALVCTQPVAVCRDTID